VSAEGAVLLDLKRDAYIGLDARQSQSLAEVVEGWPRILVLNEIGNRGDCSPLDELKSRGLLRISPQGRLATPFQVTPALHELSPWGPSSRYRVRIGQVFVFLRALLFAKLALRFLTLYSLTQRQAQRRCTLAPFDLDRARAVVGAYQKIRTWTFARRSRCMLDTLTMLNFLTHYGLYPDWIIGVHVRPFSAHTWLQHGPWVLNGTPMFVRRYEPILVV
jgi:hypothetical protein